MTRKEARDAAFKIIFEYIFLKDSAYELLARYYELFEEPGEQKEFLESLVSGCLSSVDEIDDRISGHLTSRPIMRISKVSLSVLRLAVYEILYTDLANSIAINEAVELAKKYEDPTAGKFVNGVLSSIVKEID